MGISRDSLPPRVRNKISESGPLNILTATEEKTLESEATEAQEQHRFMVWLDAAETRGELAYNQNRTDKRVTSRPGFPDFVIYPDHRPDFFIEFKLATGRISPIQKHRIQFLRDLGRKVFIARNADEAIQITEKQLTQPYVY